MNWQIAWLVMAGINAAIYGAARCGFPISATAGDDTQLIITGVLLILANQERNRHG